MEHTLSTQVHDARIELSMGLYTIRFADEAVLDVNQMKRVEAARRQLLQQGLFGSGQSIFDLFRNYCLGEASIWSLGPLRRCFAAAPQKTPPLIVGAGLEQVLTLEELEDAG